ncbi:DUF4209 domain-containing protein [Rhizobium herbae]|uniref:DUF4209 domain-containing protein n=1 Tax=Rhizobium herbae TaxID=508661 RepID=A0ABS4EPB0_9HYPH|nr:DUF4209 domain-containing protein [Rhizobium herbae]MBP1859783.1 hypothetical protein [Rhizobium herbae]
MTDADLEPVSQEHVQKNLPFWLTATLDDIQAVAFETPIGDCDSSDCGVLSTEFSKATDACKQRNDPASEPDARVFAMLQAVTNFHFRPTDRNAPFGPMMIMGDRRSAMPEDFRGDPIAVLSYAAANSKNPVLRARLADVCWLLERKRFQLGRIAISAYLDVLKGLAEGELKERFGRDEPLLGLAARDVLRRALSIARPIGWESEEAVAARTLLVDIRTLAATQGNPVPAHWFFEMDLDFGISDASTIAGAIEAYLLSGLVEPGSHIIVELWRLAARAFHSAKDEQGKYRCATAAAEALVDEALKHSSAMLGSHWLSEAISEYHGIPGKKDRRTELRHKLIDVQSGIADEMSSFSQPMDLSEIAAEVEQQLDGLDLLDALMIFADLEQSPTPEKLSEDARRSISEHPLAALMGASFHDEDGKVIHKSPGGGFGDGDNLGAVRTAIAQQESIRRSIHAAGQVLVARRYIVERFYVGEDTFHALLRHSPFVPHDVLATYSRGFARFFAGDNLTALYILTPVLENSLKHILKLNGHDVSTFDDARQVQEDRTISALFDQMRPELEQSFGDALIADIDNVFLSKPGPSLRHGVAHGFLNDSSPFGTDAIYAIWLIFRLCCVPIFPQREQIILPT